MFTMISFIFILCLALIKLYFKRTNNYLTSQRRLDGKTCIVTGGTLGMGLEISKVFAKRGAKVIIACPFEKEGNSAQQEIIKETGNDKVIFKLLDLTSFKSIRRFAQDILKTEERLDILMNNAGIPADKSITEDGFNITMQINFYGNFLLTHLLLPLLKKTGTPTEKSRIVNHTSLIHFRGLYVPDCAHKMKDWTDTEMYGTSKLYLLLYSTEMANRLRGQNVVINTADPGAVGTTTFFRSGKVVGFVLLVVLRYLVKNPWEGAQTALHVALEEDLGDFSGAYFRNCELKAAKSIVYNEKVAKNVFEETVKLVKLSRFELKYD